MFSNEMLVIIGPAFAVGLIVALAHAPLGIEVLRRGIIFIDLAVAQIAGLGLIIASTEFHLDGGWAAQGIALLFALVGGLFFRFVEQTFPRQLEAIIGCSFILAASIALLLLADQPNGGEEVQHLLSGQILFVSWRDFWLNLPIYAVILACWFLRPSMRQGIWFYVLFALAITASVPLVGVYVVFASLILPALASVKASRPNLMAWLCGVGAVLFGILVSTWMDLPAGPFLVIAYAIACLAVLGGRGLAARRTF